MSTSSINKAAVYVFRDALCKEFSFTLHFRYFKSIEEAQTYAAGFEFTDVVEF